MRKLCLAVMGTLAAGVVSAADSTWVGGTDTSYLTAANWSDGLVPPSTNAVTIKSADVVYDAADTTTDSYSLNLGVQAANGGTLTLTDGTLTTRRLTLYGTADEPAVYTQNGGTLSFNSDDTSVWTVGTTKEAAQIVITGGTFAGYHMLQLGNGSSNNNNAFGWWKQTGGATTFGSYVVLGRYVSDWGYMDLSGGTFTLTDAGKYMLVGELGNGELNVTGTAQLTVPSILLGRSSCTSSKVTVKDSAVICTGSFWTECKIGVLTFDGGTVTTRVDNTINTFIGANITAQVASGGANLAIGTGCIATVAVPLVEDATSTGGGLVKTGAGTLILTGANTYTGATKVQEGTLVLAYPPAGTLEVSAGATVGFDPANYTDAQIQALAAQVKAAGGNLAIYTTADATISQALDIGTGHVEKYGTATLTLTGANAWTGDTIIYAGLLKAARGTGLPADSKVIVKSGTWAPLAASVTDKLELPGTLGSAGLTAIDSSLTVNLNDGATLTQGADQFTNGLLLNDTAADQPLVIQNPLAYGTDAQKTDLTVTVNSTAADAKVTLAGTITGSNNKHVYKNGNGTLELTGGSALGGGWFVNNAGTSNFSKAEDGEAPTFTLCDFRTYDGTLNLNVETTVNVTGWARFGMGAAATVVNVNGATVTVPQNYRFVVGESSGAATANIYSGSLTAGLLEVGNGAGVGTINQYGGTVTTLGCGGGVDGTRIGEFDNNTKLVGTGVYNLYDGTALWQYNVQVGAYGVGTFNQSGGTASMENNGWLVMGRFEGGTGTYNLTGGTYDQNANGVIVGEGGAGTLNISGTGVFKTQELRLASLATSSGTVNIGAGGRLRASYVDAYYSAQTSSAGNGQGVGTVAFNVDGGTVEATADAGNFFQRLTDIQIGTKGMTFDNGGKAVGFYGSNFAPSSGTLTLTGTGTTTLAGQLPPVSEVVVKNGTTVNVADNGKKELVHRWSFNGDLTDSVGGSDATTIESGTTACTFVDDAKVKLAGGTKGQGGSLDLGQNLVSTTGPVTFELWCSVDADQKWSKIFLIGSSGSDYIGMNACTSTGDGWTGVSGVTGGATIANNMTGTGYATRGTEFYYVMTLVPDGNKGTYLMATRQDATTGKILNRVRLYNASWRFSNLKQTANYLGRSYWSDLDASVTVNEFRIWKGAFTEDDSLLSAALGPDTLPNFTEAKSTGDSVLPDDASDELVANNYLTHRWSFNHGSLRDSVGGRVATLNGTVTNAPALNAVVTPGGTKGIGWVDLKSDLLPKTGPVTIEMWVTPHNHQRWSPVLTIGSSTANYVVFGEYCDNSGKNGKMFLCINNTDNNVGSLPVPTMGKPYHAAITFVPQAAGNMAVTLSLRDLAGNLIGHSDTLSYNGWTIGGKLVQTNCWLGHAMFNDPDAGAVYDEVRVWNAALSDAQLVRNAKLGPDTLPTLAPNFTDTGAVTLNVEAGASVNLMGGTVEQSIVTGAGTVTNGTLVVTGILDPDPTLTIPGSSQITGTYIYDADDLVTVNGDVDLTGATFQVRTAADLKGNALVLKTSDGTVTGTMDASSLRGTGYKLSYGTGTVRLVRDGLSLFVR